MDISKASNFERFIFDLTGRDPAAVRALWQKVELDGGFDLGGTPLGRRLRRCRIRVRQQHACRSPRHHPQAVPSAMAW